MTTFPAKFFKNNRQRLRDLIKTEAPIVITANGLMQRNSDINYPFRQDSSFWYLTGINEPDVIAVIGVKEEYLILPKRDKHHDVFDGPVNKPGLAKTSGFNKILDEEPGWEGLKAELKTAKQIATLAPPPAYVDFFGFYTNPTRDRLVQDLKDLKPSLEILDLKLALTSMRMIKQAEEVKAIQEAIDITTATLKDVESKVANYKYEHEIEADIAYGFRKRGAAGHAFPPIIAGGKNACTIHYLSNDASLNKARFVLLDVGAEVNNYAADISRTYWRHAKTKREEAIYKSAKEAQNFAISLLKPGVTYKDYEKQMEKFMGEQLLKLGLIKTASRKQIRRYFPHPTSHQLGLDPHDIENYEAELAVNMVMAVEPGIYIPAEGIGVRIEDNVLIIKNGCKILSA